MTCRAALHSTLAEPTARDQGSLAARVHEIHAALEKIKVNAGRQYKSLAMSKRDESEATGARVPLKPLHKEKQPGNLRFRAVFLEPKFWCGWQESNPRPLGS